MRLALIIALWVIGFVIEAWSQRRYGPHGQVRWRRTTEGGGSREASALHRARHPSPPVLPRRVPQPRRHQWQICADGNVFRPVCAECDIELNRLVLTWAGDPDAPEKLARYTAKMARAA